MATSTTERIGLLLIDKPAGVTSHDVIAIVRRAMGVRRAGHTGTLDPFATGLLVVLLGRGTRLMPYVDGEPKVYDARIQFGAETTTDDRTGAVVRESAAPDAAAIDAAIDQLTGPIDQIPPAFSAKQVAGVRAYDAARRGTPAELAPCRVVVHAWQILSREPDEIDVRITCSGGTYIRALARDLGRLAGSAAHLSALRRVRSGPFAIEEATPLDAIAAGVSPLRPLRDAVASLPSRRVTPPELARVVHGNSIPAQTADERVALFDDEQSLIGVAVRSGDELRPTLVLRDA